MNKPPLANRVPWDFSEYDDDGPSPKQRTKEPQTEKERLYSEILVRQRSGIRSGHPGQPIMCNETGQTFPTTRKLVEAMGIDRQSLFKHLRGERKTVKGYTFSRITSCLPEEV